MMLPVFSRESLSRGSIVRARAFLGACADQRPTRLRATSGGGRAPRRDYVELVRYNALGQWAEEVVRGGWLGELRVDEQLGGLGDVLGGWWRVELVEGRTNSAAPREERREKQKRARARLTSSVR